MNPAFLPRALTAGLAGAGCAAGARTRRRPSTRSRSEPTGSRRPSMAASSRRWPTAPTRNTASTSPSCRAAPTTNNRILLIAGKLDFFMTRKHAAIVRRGRQQRAGGRGRRHLPEGSAGFPDPSGNQGHQARGSQAADAARVQGRCRELFPVAEIRIRFQREQGQALHLQSAALHRQQAERDAGLCHLGAVRGREGRRASSPA